MLPSADAQKLCTIREACLIAKVSRRTIYNWLMRGKLKYVRTAGGSVRIVADSLLHAQDGGWRAAK